MPEAPPTETPSETPVVEADAAAALEAAADTTAATETPAAPSTEPSATPDPPAGPPGEIDRLEEASAAGQAGTTAPGSGTEEGAAAFDPSPFIGWGLSFLVVVLFVYALRRARARQRAEFSGEKPDLDAPERALERASKQVPATAAEPAAIPSEPGPEPADPKNAEKEARRQAFLVTQTQAREEAEAQRSAEAKTVAAEEAQKQEALAAREAEEAARRAALLAPSGSLTDSLARTRGGLIGRLGRVLGRAIDDEALEEIEEVLFAADIGVHTATTLVEEVRNAAGKGVSGESDLKTALRTRIEALLEIPGNGEIQLDSAKAAPFVIMVVGVNGVGKTTTIGKLAGRLIAKGHKVLLAAGDTFRAAAVEQLEVWGERVGAEVVKGGDSADPASVIFDAIEHGKATGVDVVIADTAGRLHTKAPLMDELQKIHRVMGKAREAAPDEVLLVVDATTGQNALQQARLFRETVDITGIALTKLDGTAKGGVVIAITSETGLPIRYIGTGEQVGDLRPFETAAFVEALFEEVPGPDGADSLPESPGG